MSESNDRRDRKNNFIYPLIVGVICAVLGGWFGYATQDKKEDSLVKSMASRFDSIEENMELEHALDKAYEEYAELKDKEQATSNANSSLENELGKKLDATVSNPALVVEGLKKKESIGKGVAEVDGDIFFSADICAEIYGKGPTYVKDKNTVYFSEKSNETKETKVKLIGAGVIYEAGDYFKIIRTSDDEGFYLGSDYYREGIQLAYDTYALFDLKGQYSKLDFDVARIPDTPNYNATLKFFLDGELSESYTLYSEAPISHITVDLNNAKIMKLVYDCDSGSNYGLVNCTLTK